MEKILLKGIEKKANKIQYNFAVSAGLSRYFSARTFEIEYAEMIESVPDSIAAIPFVCCVLPLIWLTDSTLELAEIDESFFRCLPEVKKGYETMFPESQWLGEVKPERVVSCPLPQLGKSATLFSGGLDAVHTLVRHLEERPALISIWGSDIAYENAPGWEVVHHGIEQYAKQYELPDVVIKSTFREFDKEGMLSGDFGQQLKDGWWHGVKHGIGLLGHTAPYAYLHGLSTVYIASSNCPSDGPVRCASNPLIDNYVRFANCRVIHDGFECSRQDKVRDVVAYAQQAKERLLLHVCWESQIGSNCCHCEKCYRTIAGLLAEGADPKEYGFDNAWNTLRDMQRYLIGQGELSAAVAIKQWTHIQNAMLRNRVLLQAKPYWKQIKWIAKSDFSHPETLRMPKIYYIRWRFLRLKLYKVLRKIKHTIIKH